MEKLILTPQQQAAVENRGGSLLVSAAAGSGKTKVLVERIFHYIDQEHCNIDDFLIITYTKAAAAELRSKIVSELNRRLSQTPGDAHWRSQLLRVYQADIKTVDAFCMGLLRENTRLLAREGERYTLTPDFMVLDDNDAQLLRRRVLNRVLEGFYDTLDDGGAALADTLGAGRDDSKLEELVLEVYGKIQSHADPDAWLAESKRIWQTLPDSFEETPYALELLTGIRRKALHWAQRLRRCADTTRGDDGLWRGYGEKFLVAAASFDALALAGDWNAAISACLALTFPRLNTPKGRKEEPEVLTLKQSWEGAKDAAEELKALLSVSGAEAMEDLRAVAPAMEALLTLTEAFAAAYQEEKRRRNRLDFSDQEHFALRLLVGEDGLPTELGEQVAARYQEILVDEYQDTNEIQNAIFRAVSRQGNNLFTVGDVKQSIYRFRLADPTIFLEKYRRFRPCDEARETEERKVLLSQNFRSRQEILDAANFIFENILSEEMGEMEYGDDEALHFGAAYYPPRDDCDTEFHLIAVEQRTEEETRPIKRAEAEGRFVARRIRALLDEGFPVTGEDGALRPCVPEDIVILMRSPGSRTTLFAQALSREGIPCSFQENDDFFHTMEISVMLSLLEILDNPRQDVPLISVLRSPLFGFSPDRLALIRGKTPEGDYFDAVTANGGADCEAFLEKLRSLRRAGREMSVGRLIWQIYQQLNVLGIFAAMDSGAQRRENLIALSQQAERFEASGYKGLFLFVTHLRHLLEQEQLPGIQSAASGAGVQLMSIHKSKGLEFPIVILADLERSFSRQDFQTSILVHPTLGLGPVRVDLQRKICYPTLARRALEEKLRRENLSEEQRLLYVAMTRPKEKLILVDALYHAPTRLKRLCAAASCPVQPETVAEGRCFGDWILLALLCRAEAEPLRALAGTGIGEIYTGNTAPWKVFCHTGAALAGQEVPAAVQTGPEEAEPTDAWDPALLEFRYPYESAARLPVKVTATQLKGRVLDEEIAQETRREFFLRPLSRPKFCRDRQGLTAAERGTATHLVLQYLDFSDRDAAGQIERLRRRHLLTEEQAAAVPREAVERFLASPLAEEIRRSPGVLREYPFSLQISASAYDPSAAPGDEMLLQGVVDCCFESPDGLVVVDFKTDRVPTEETLHDCTERYRPQLETYSRALERVLERPVVRRVLYFLDAGQAREV